MKRIVLALLAACGGGDGQPSDASNDAAGGVPDADPGGTMISYTVYSAGGWQAEPDDIVLVRDGDDGPWVRVEPVGDVYRTRVVGPRYVVARACRTTDLLYGEVWLFHMTLDDTTDLRDIGCRAAVDAPTLSGSLVGVAVDQRGAIATTRGGGSFGLGATMYSAAVGPGRTDLVGRLTPQGTIRPTQRLLIERDLDISASTVHDLDFAADGFAPEEHVVAIDDAGGGDVEQVVVGLATANGSYLIESTAGATDRYHAPPSGQLAPGDLLTVSRSTLVGSSRRATATVVTAPIDITGTLPPQYVAGAPTVTTTPTSVGLEAALPPSGDADFYTAWAFQSDAITFQTTYWVQAYTSRWAGDESIVVTFPDFSSVDGWSVGLTTTSDIQWGLGWIGSTLTDLLPPGAYGFGATTVAGDTVDSSEQTGTLTP